MALSYVGLRFRKTLNGGNPAMTNAPLVHTSYEDGNILRLNTTGSGVRMAAGATAGMAYVMIGSLANANWAATGRYPVYLLDGNNVFEARILATGARSARVGDSCGVAVGSTYNYRLAATAGPLKVTGYHPDEAATTTGANGRFYVTGRKCVWGVTQSAPGAVT
jgi:hypothetical protein